MDIVTIQNLKKYFGEGAGQVKALEIGIASCRERV